MSPVISVTPRVDTPSRGTRSGNPSFRAVESVAQPETPRVDGSSPTFNSEACHVTAALSDPLARPPAGAL